MTTPDMRSGSAERRRPDALRLRLDAPDASTVIADRLAAAVTRYLAAVHATHDVIPASGASVDPGVIGGTLMPHCHWVCTEHCNHDDTMTELHLAERAVRSALAEAGAVR